MSRGFFGVPIPKGFLTGFPKMKSPTEEGRLLFPNYSPILNVGFSLLVFVF
jgi:hypothetical protein